MALSGSFNLQDLSLTLPNAYIRIEGAGVERTGSGWRVLIRAAVYASQQAAASGAQPVSVRYVDANTLAPTTAQLVITQLYNTLKLQTGFTNLADVLEPGQSAV